MDEEAIMEIQEALEHARGLREQADEVENNIAEEVGLSVQEWLDLGKKTEALKLIGKVYGQSNERSKFWFDYFQKLIFKHM